MNEDWRTNETIVTIVDVILLGLIRAHDGDGDDFSRLRAAKKAIFGISSGRGRKPDRDLPELFHMATEYVKERGEYEIGENYVPYWPSVDERQMKSKSQLAREALCLRKGRRIHNQDQRVRLLEQKFTAQQQILLKLVVGWGADTHDEVISYSVHDFQELLVRLGIPFKFEIPPSHDGNALN